MSSPHTSDLNLERMTFIILMRAFSIANVCPCPTYQVPHLNTPRVVCMSTLSQWRSYYTYVCKDILYLHTYMYIHLCVQRKVMQSLRKKYVTRTCQKVDENKDLQKLEMNPTGQGSHSMTWLYEGQSRNGVRGQNRSGWEWITWN